eukprot:7833217-Alexandrium_andersonii.AAC.1
MPRGGHRVDRSSGARFVTGRFGMVPGGMLASGGSAKGAAWEQVAVNAFDTCRPAPNAKQQ